MTVLEMRKTDLINERDHLQREQPVLLHPSLAETYRQKVALLIDTLHDISAQAEAASLSRGLRIVSLSSPHTGRI